MLFIFRFRMENDICWFCWERRVWSSSGYYLCWPHPRRKAHVRFSGNFDLLISVFNVHVALFTLKLILTWYILTLFLVEGSLFILYSYYLSLNLVEYSLLLVSCIFSMPVHWLVLFISRSICRIAPTLPITML